MLFNYYCAGLGGDLEDPWAIRASFSSPFLSEGILKQAESSAAELDVSNDGKKAIKTKARYLSFLRLQRRDVA